MSVIYNSMPFVLKIMRERNQGSKGNFLVDPIRNSKVEPLHLYLEVHTLSPSLSRHTHVFVFLFVNDNGNILLLGCGLLMLHYKHFVLLVCSLILEELLAIDDKMHFLFIA